MASATPASAGYNNDSSSSGGGNAVAMDAVELDPSSGASFFNVDFKRHDDLKQMLDSSKDSHKLEAMKRIIGMVARGRDAGDLFPAVVKNVVSKNIEVKKLVYVYLTRYAEEQQDLALLSISTFQRALKDPNQLIRASALRVLSSIRVPVLVPIVQLAIRDSSVDMSPFVRKTAAHAIPKLFSLDPEQKEELVGVIDKLLGDRTTLVVGSAVMAFEEVCPERIELVHKSFRKLCNLLVDVEEWGQVVIVNMLTRYARTQFVDPNAQDTVDELEEERDFYSDEDEDDEEGEDKKRKKKGRPDKPKMDPDHRLLLRSAKPLLQSRNASVVMATAQLYHHCAPKAEVQVVAKAMIRLLRSHREVQALVLNSIASMTSSGKKRRNSMFEPFLRNFFVRSSDPTHIKILKLEIITNMAAQSNIGVILREFQSYITSQDKTCVAATIQAIGRCAASIEEVTDTCLNGLVHLLSNRDQAVVAESVVVIKKLLQTQSGDHKEIIVQMAKLADSISVPAARAAILWVVGEYCERVPKVAPDVLRKFAKSFVNEEPQVKMQVLNLAVKLCLTNPEQTRLLAQYVFNLAKYDQDYDIRDRARFMRGFLFPTISGADGNDQEIPLLLKNAKKVFLSTKPAPVTESKFKDRDVFQLGSLSHFLNAKASGYQDLPDFPVEAPDASVRNVEPPKAPNPWEKSPVKEARPNEKEGAKKKGFYSEHSTDEDEEGSTSGSSSGTSDSSGSSTSSDSDSGSESEEDVKKATKNQVNGVKRTQTAAAAGATAASATKKKPQTSESSESSSGSEESSSEDEPVTKPSKRRQNPKEAKSAAAAAPTSNLDLLLDLSTDVLPSMPTPMLTPSLGGFLTPSGPSSTSLSEGGAIADATAVHVSSRPKELLSKMSSGGLQLLYRYTRSPHLYAKEMCNVELTINNLGDEELTGIKVGAKTLAPGLALHDFPGIASLASGASVNATLGINFNDTTQAAKFDLVASSRCHAITINPIIGELIRAVQMPETVFNEHRAKLGGMNETETSASLPSTASDEQSVRQRVYEAANVLQVPSSDQGVLKFAGRTMASQALVLVTLKVEGANAEVRINCEKMVVGSMLAKELKAKLEEN